MMQELLRCMLRRWMTIAGPAAVGALVGALIGGVTGAVIGAVVLFIWRAGAYAGGFVVGYRRTAQ